MIPGSSTTQPMCETCAFGFFKANTSSSSTKTDSCTAVQNVTCPPGKYINATAIGEPECESCAHGFFKDIISSASTRNDSCVAHTKCPAGKYTSTSGNAIAEPKCEVCTAGFFKDFTSRSSTCVGRASTTGTLSSQNADAKGDFWQVVSGARFCEIVDGGRCVSDGDGKYGPNENCKVKALRPLLLTTPLYSVEKGYDYLTVAGVQYNREHTPAWMPLARGAELVWRTDGSVVRDGFKVCASEDAETNGGLVVVGGLVG